MDPVLEPQATTSTSQRRWQPLSARQRRVLGVLVEKAKTTPDVYPLTLNSLVAGCNQKSNRSPVVNYSAADVEETLEQLRALGAVSEVIGEAGRVPRYKHHLYEWLGVNKTELAVMAELMLRGEQTIGQLRTHVSRMEPIKDLTEMKSILDGLVAKELVMALTPPGRGQVFCHTLYKERELEELRARYAAGGGAPREAERPSVESSGQASPGHYVTADMFAELQLEVAYLGSEVAQLKERLSQLEKHGDPSLADSAWSQDQDATRD